MDISHLDPEIQFYLRRVWALVDPKTVAKDIEEKRWLFERRTLAWNLPAPEDIEQMDWAMNLPGRELTFRMHRPVGAERPPVVLYFHGGGWSLGSYKTHDMVTWEMARGTGAAVINVNYRRTPESVYPAAVDDAYDALHWVEKFADFLKVDASRICVAGDSAGGHLAAAVSLRVRDQGGPKIAYQGLIYPMLSLDFDSPSYTADRDPASVRANNMFYWGLFLDGKLDTEDPYAVPMRATDLSGLPPAYVMAVEFDSLRDDAVRYAERLRQAGVAVDFSEVMGSCHGMMRAGNASRTARVEITKLHDAIKRHLQ